MFSRLNRESLFFWTMENFPAYCVFFVATLAFLASFLRRPNHATVICGELILLTAYIHSQAVYELPFGSTPTVFSEASINEPCRFASVIKTDYHNSPLHMHYFSTSHAAVSYIHFFSSGVPNSIATPWIQYSFTSWFHIPIYFLVLSCLTWYVLKLFLSIITRGLSARAHILIKLFIDFSNLFVYRHIPIRDHSWKKKRVLVHKCPCTELP